MVSKQKTNKKWIIIPIMLILAVAIAVGVYFVLKNTIKSGDKVDDGAESVQVIESAEAKKEDEKQEGEVVEKEKIRQYEGEDPNESESLTGVVTYAGVSGDELTIRTSIDQYLTAGLCELSLIQSGVAKYQASAAIVGAATAATCEGFDIPVSALGTGRYQIEIKLTGAGAKAGMIKGEVEL